MAIQNNGITFNVSDNANVTLTQSPNHSKHYNFGTIKPNSRLDAIDASYAHLAGVVATADSLIVDEEYHGDKHLLSLLQSMSLNTRLVLDMLDSINITAQKVTEQVA